MKSILKKIFRSLPFRKPFIYLLRALGGGYWLPDIIKEYLVFEGNFKIAIPKSDISFIMQNGYGRQIEAKCFWNGFNAFEPETINLWRQLVLNSRVILVAQMHILLHLD